MVEELKPCPFCGGEAAIWSAYRDNDCKEVYSIWCDNEDCMNDCSTLDFTSIDAAVTEWNKRAERTCKVENIRCEGFNGFYVILSCGHRYLTFLPRAFQYCPECGARVVK